MTKFLSYLIIAIGVLAVASWPTPAQAHVPEIGEKYEVTRACKEGASRRVLKAYEEDGEGAAGFQAVQSAKRGGCRGFASLWIIVAAVDGPVYTPDDLIVYRVRLDFVDVLEGRATESGGPWFAFHKHEIEGQEI